MDKDKDKTESDPRGPENPSDTCLDELVAVAKRYGFRIAAQAQVRLGDDGRLIVGAVWGLAPHA